MFMYVVIIMTLKAPDVCQMLPEKWYRKSGTAVMYVPVPVSKVVQQFAIPYREDAHVLLRNRPEGLWECPDLLQRGLGRSSGRQRILLLSKHHKMPLFGMLQQGDPVYTV